VTSGEGGTGKIDECRDGGQGCMKEKEGEVALSRGNEAQ